jgi:hypothetical protein
MLHTTAVVYADKSPELRAQVELARSSTSNRQDAESRGFTGVLGALATLRGILLPAH